MTVRLTTRAAAAGETSSADASAKSVGLPSAAPGAEAGSGAQKGERAEAKSSPGLDPMTSVSFVPGEMEVRISCDGGRCCRPLLRVPRAWSAEGLAGGAGEMRGRGGGLGGN